MPDDEREQIWLQIINSTSLEYTKCLSDLCNISDKIGKYSVVGFIAKMSDEEVIEFRDKCRAGTVKFY